MADPAFAEMGEETETFIPQVRFPRTRADKLTAETPNETETNPLLGPAVLSDRLEKKWYNTPSV